jgi:hypothetical protein
MLKSKRKQLVAIGSRKACAFMIWENYVPAEYREDDEIFLDDGDNWQIYKSDTFEKFKFFFDHQGGNA